MKRVVLCVANPQDYIDQLTDYSLMIVNPAVPDSRKQYLFDHCDWSIKITDTGQESRAGGDYANERVLWYTSGTSGDSKFCSFTQQQLDIMSRTICSAYNITANDRYVSIMPLWHAHGQGFYWATKLAQCETHFVTFKDLKTVPRYHPTFITAIPDFLRLVGRLNFDQLRFVRSASAPLPNNLYQQLKEKYQVPIIEAFGMTEALSHCFTNPLEGEQRVGTVGLPSGIDARIDDHGHLFIQGPSVCVDSWYDTGDLAEQDDRGYYKILGRSRDQINVRGIKLNPLSLEKQLQDNIDDLGECVVFGSDRVKCLYTGTCDMKQIHKFLASLGPTCRPMLLKHVDAIPLTSSGKISRSALNKIF